MSERAMGYSHLAQVASITADGYLKRAIESVNEAMGPGAAKQYPQIVAAVIAAAAGDYAAAMLSHRVVPALEDVSDAIRGVGESIGSTAAG